MRNIIADSPECDADPFKAAFAWARSALVWSAHPGHHRTARQWRAMRWEWVVEDAREMMEALHLAIDAVVAANPWIMGGA